MNKLTHFDETGAARMVDVSHKEPTQRLARAGGEVSMRPETLQMIRQQTAAKGDVLQVARLAGVMGAKKTADLIPLCHPLGLDSVEITFDFADNRTLQIEARVGVFARTGVEMEALAAVSVAALTIYDMCKAVDREMTISSIKLLEKSGGRSGHFLRDSQQT